MFKTIFYQVVDFDKDLNESDQLTTSAEQASLEAKQGQAEAAPTSGSGLSQCQLSVQWQA